MSQITNKPIYGQVIGEVRSGKVIFTDSFMAYIDDMTRNVDTVDWGNVDKTGSKLTDIQTRNHSSLQNIGEVDDTSADTVKDKHVSNADLKANTDHRAATNVHGAAGDLVGNLNTATALVNGVVLLASAVTDATASTVSVTSPDATDLASVITLANEMKADLSTLVTDLNSTIIQVNALLANSRTAGQLATT